jgi:hypothetical protein
MATAARPRTTDTVNATVGLEAATLSRVQLVCDFVNAEVAHLRNRGIAIAATCAIAAIVLPIVTGIGDPRIPLVLAGGGFTFWFFRAWSELRTNLANIAAKRLVAALSKELTYKSGSSLTQQQFVATDLYGEAATRFTSRDEIGGRSRGIRFTVHRVRASGKEKDAVIFDGAVIRVDFPTPFPSHTVILPDRAGQLPGSHARPGTRVKKDLVLLKHPAFERMFSVYATDYYEARRVVTPKLMVLVMEAAETFGADVRLAFVQKSLFVMVPSQALRVQAPLFGAPLTPREAVGTLQQLVTFAEGLTVSVAE